MQSAWTLLSWGPEGWLDDIAYGVLVTVSLALATLPFGLFIGFFVALAKQSQRALAAACRQHLHDDLPRPAGTAHAVSSSISAPRSACRASFASFDPDATIEINSFVSGMVALGVVFSSYASEVFLSAFRAIPHGQYEGGYAIGLTNGQTMRLVVLPQLIRIALPGLANLWLILLKDTALVSAIGLADILRQAGIAARVTKHAFLFFGVASLIYLVLAIISSFGIHAIERAVGSRRRIDERGRASIAIDVDRPPPLHAAGRARASSAMCWSGCGSLVGIGLVAYLVLGLEPGTLRQVCAGLPVRPRRDADAGRHLDRARRASSRFRSPMRACRRTGSCRRSPTAMSISSAARRCSRRPS